MEIRSKFRQIYAFAADTLGIRGELVNEESELPGVEADITVKECVPARALAEEHAADILEEIHPFLEMAREAYRRDENGAYRHGTLKAMVAARKLIKGHRTDTEVYVCILRNKSVVFAFRGTELTDFESIRKDFCTDINEAQAVVELYKGSGVPVYTSSSDIRAHSGFQAALREVTERKEDNLVCVLKKLGMDAEDAPRVVCVGHSLGGALATLCAKWCREVAFPQAEIGCVTIGSPRVGNEAFAADFEKRVVNPGLSYRLVNKRDAVPCLPNWWTYWNWRPPYKHVSRPIYLWEDEARDMRSCLGGQRPTFPTFWSLFFGDSFRDHTIASYVASSLRALRLRATSRGRFFLIRPRCPRSLGD